ncbi:unnamed protein product [Protopolystoma xenopodis]|uniref:Uncharacterized protein n=1 Tax=Protopolystoma xenopodis TaxID=117903 RepID=A0A3S5ADY1_9PLAT|nr:unnamed protein product [Protopolystoma xenopodis]
MVLATGAREANGRCLYILAYSEGGHFGFCIGSALCQQYACRGAVVAPSPIDRPTDRAAAVGSNWCGKKAAIDRPFDASAVRRETLDWLGRCNCHALAEADGPTQNRVRSFFRLLSRLAYRL